MLCNERTDQKGNLFFRIILWEYIMNEEFKRWLINVDVDAFLSAWLMGISTSYKVISPLNRVFFSHFCCFIKNDYFIELFSVFSPNKQINRAAHFYSDSHFVVFSAEKLIQWRFVSLKEATCEVFMY